MNEHIENLIEQWLEGSLDTVKQDELSAWVKKHPNHMQQFVEASAQDQMLRGAAKSAFLEQRARELAEERVELPRQKTRRGNGRPLVRVVAAIVAVAACLLIALSWYGTTEPGSTGPGSAEAGPFLSVAMTQDTLGDLKAGDRLGAETIELKGGIMRLIFDDGVEVTLQGPAEYELIELGKTRLVSGLLTATVPPGAEGFQVDTPSAQVVDLGTAFGVELRPDGSSQVTVFDGEVEVLGQKEPGKRHLTEGETIQVAADGSVIETEFASKQFEKLWPTASGIAGSTGAFKFAPQWPRMLKQIESDEDIFILPEGYAMELEQSCEVDMTGNEMSQSAIPSGQRVRSFLLQFNPVDSGNSQRGPANRGFRQRGSKQRKRIKGNITFQRPILGLVVKTETLKKTDDLFSLRRAGGLMGRGLEFKPPRMADEISISEDRMTLTLDLAVINRLSDHVRVIVDAELAEPNN